MTNEPCEEGETAAVVLVFEVEDIKSVESVAATWSVGESPNRI